jgi:hypothetical protein
VFVLVFFFAVVGESCLCDNSMSYSPGCSPIMKRRARSLIVEETPLPLSPKIANPKRKRVLKKKKSPHHKSPSRRGQMLKHPLLALQCKTGKEGETDSNEENSSDDADQSNLSNVSVFTMYLNVTFTTVSRSVAGKIIRTGAFRLTVSGSRHRQSCMDSRYP